MNHDASDAKARAVRVGNTPQRNLAASVSRRRWLAVTAAAGLAPWAASTHLAQAQPGAARVVDLQGHRGARGLLPESTLDGFARALAIGVTTLELDTGVTSDGVVVVHHDRRLNADHTRDAEGRFITPPGPLLKSLSLADLQRLDVGRARPESRTARTFVSQQPRDGARIPTLADVFQLTQRLRATHVRFNIETKLSPLNPEETLAPEAFARAVLGVVREFGMVDRCCLQSFDWRSLRAARALQPGIATAHLTSQQPNGPGIDSGIWTDGHTRAAHGSAARMVKAAGGSIWSPFFGDVNADLVAEAQSLGVAVAVWTVNEVVDIDRMLDLGVDALITDYPDRARDALLRRGWPVAPAVAVPNAPARP